MALSKLCPRCQGIMAYDKRMCDKCTEVVGSHRAVRDKIYQDNRNDKEYQAIYKNPRWKMVRKQALVKANGLCEACIKQGKISYVDDVHHKIPIKVNMAKAYDINNLICLCRSCHMEAHKELKR